MVRGFQIYFVSIFIALGQQELGIVEVSSVAAVHIYLPLPLHKKIQREHKKQLKHIAIAEALQ